ncbi:rho GTPase-activating protein 45 isoform X2 [Eublepharis macularius]|uniref:Rho GTPase-activating protein 45 isoform X2 n=1 Tax=Eublepharis macularius TaxID=481883 RepID=A0AA97KYQ8_EUBMA|nr:rho GTPase-activating protein 45 isoform X2 [Eublepharis macularius]
MFSRKKRELMKTPSISKKCRAGSPVPQASLELPRRDGQEMSASSLVDLSASATTATLKRPTSLSRHASAAGFPLSPVVPRGIAKAPKPHITHSPCETYEETVLEAEDIAHLLADVARFAEGLEKLRDVMLQEGQVESHRSLAHECLGEALRILRQVINKYPLLNTLETLTAAGTLISKVKGFNYEAKNEGDKREFEKALETIAVSFSSTVSEFLMGEVDSSTLLSIPLSDHNQSMENIYTRITGQGMEEMPAGMEDFDSNCLSVEEVDILLQKTEGGVEVALQYAKNISKYMKNLIAYLDKRTTLEIEFAKGIHKMVNTCKLPITQERDMPLLSIYSLALEQDLEYSMTCLQANNNLRMETFLQPLTTRRLEHEKRRKEIKEQWHRAQRKLQEAESNLRKAKQMYMQRSEDLEKAKSGTVKAEEEQQVASSTAATKALDKRRRLEDEARNKADEAMATYRTCIADANTQKQELEDTKVNALRQIHEVVKQSDQVIKLATIAFYQIMHIQTAPLPVHFQTLCESSKLYDPGQQYASHAKRLQRGDEPETLYDFEPYMAHNGSPLPRVRKGSSSTSELAVASGSETAEKDAASEGDSTATLQSGSAPVERRGGRGHQVHKSWPTSITETKSNLKAHSTSSGLAVTAPEMASSTGPFRNVGLSKAARTHRLRKLRTPAKCRECNSYVYFQGAECEECCLSCHKKCLETLAIQCGHKKLQGKLQLFGQDFLQASHASSDAIPFIIKKCICEIEKRALKTKGIYRVNGVKTRVEKLCQAFENGKELVELSQASPHDISNVLKLYLRQLPEPIMPFRTYNNLMGFAKESLQGGAEGKAAKNAIELVDKGAETDQTVVTLVTKLKELLCHLPRENLATLKYIVQHLRRIVEVEQDNKMSPGNLGIVFGPTLMRPRPTEATISLSSLVDYPHQARIVEALIIFYSAIFEEDGVFLEEEPEQGTTGNQEDAGSQPHSSSPYLVGTPEQTENADYDSYTGPPEHYIDSDSEQEDGAEADAEELEISLAAPGSETSSDEETPPPHTEASEGDARTRTDSVGQSDSEIVLPSTRLSSQEEEPHELEDDAVFRRGTEVEDGEG